MKKPEDCTLEELKPYASEYISRIRMGKPARKKILTPCKDCGELLGVSEKRGHKKFCPATATKKSMLTPTPA